VPTGLGHHTLVQLTWVDLTSPCGVVVLLLQVLQAVWTAVVKLGSVSFVCLLFTFVFAIMGCALFKVTLANHMSYTLLVNFYTLSDGLHCHAQAFAMNQ
jgi:hypothetical protein